MQLVAAGLKGVELGADTPPMTTTHARYALALLNFAVAPGHVFWQPICDAKRATTLAS